VSQNVSQIWSTKAFSAYYSSSLVAENCSALSETGDNAIAVIFIQHLFETESWVAAQQPFICLQDAIVDIPGGI
jgi:hypothetical protein